MAFDLLSFLLGKSTGSGGGGGSAALGPKTIQQNGVYRAASDNLDGYNTVTVEVPNSYAAADEGKVVANGALLAQTSRTITENGTFDTTLNNEVVVNVSGGGDLSIRDVLYGAVPTGDITLVADANIPRYSISGRRNMDSLTIDLGNTYDFVRASAASYTVIYNNLPKLKVITNHNLTTPEWFYTANVGSPSVVVMVGAWGNIGQNAFRANTGFTTLDYTFNRSSTMGQNAFYGDPAFNTLILRGETVMALQTINAFSNATHFRSGGAGGTLYVPSALISNYQAATNWSTILGYENNQILPIEGSIYETQYADGTPIAA